MREANYQSFTFTIPITPMFTVDSKEAREMAETVDRKLTLSYDSLIFLQSHGFDLSKTLECGVPYLNREEVEEITDQLLRDKTYERIDPSCLGQIAEWFDSRLRRELTEWLETEPREVCTPRYSLSIRYVR